MTMSANEVDNITQRVWQAVDKGNVKYVDKHIDTFLKMNAPHLDERAEMHIEPIYYLKLKSVCQKAKKSVVGLDLWSPAEFTLICDDAFKWLARLRNTIEVGHEWLEQMCSVTVAFLLIDANGDDNPFAFWVLLIMPTLYRRWATMRLDDLEHWISTWAHPAMMAGVKEKGADDAWWLNGLAREDSHLHSDPDSGGGGSRCFHLL